MFISGTEKITVHQIADLYTEVRFEGSMNSASIEPAKREGSYLVKFDVEDSNLVSRKGQKTVRGTANVKALINDLAAHAAR